MFRTPPTRRRVPSIEALEPRLLFSADPVGAADAAAAAWVASVPTEAIAWQGRSAAEGDIGTDTEPASRGGAVTAARELALVDVRVPDADRLLAELHGQRDAGRPIDVLVVGEGDDAIAALDAALSGAQGTYRAVHLFGHGEPGSMLLGDGALDLATLRARAGEVAGWSLGLAEGADLLLWGCDAGAGAAGGALLDALSALTGADVAASTDATGGLAAGGNWVLEAARGAIEAAAPIGAALRAEFAGRLALTPTPSGEVAVATAQSVQEGGTNSTAGRQVAASAAGTVLVWVDTDGERILAQRYAADGSLRGAVLTIDADNNGPRMPSVAMDDAGNLLVAWSIDGQARLGYVRAAEADGGRTNFDGTSFKVNSGDGVVRTPGQVSVDLSPDGRRGVVVWSEDHGINRDISAQRLSISPGSGAALSGSKIQITKSQGLWDGHPDAGIADDGAIIVVLASTPGLIERDSGIFSFRVAAGSDTATPDRRTYGDRVSPTVEPNNAVQVTPAFALGADGRGLAVWVDTSSGTSLWARVIGPTGPTGAVVQIPTDTGHVVGRPSVAAIAGGGWVVAWETAPDSVSVPGSDYGIRAIRVDATGTPDASTRTVVDSTIKGDQRAPSVAVAGSRMVIAWTGPGGGQGGTSALVMRTFALDGLLAIDAVEPVAVPENGAATTVTLRATVDGTPQTGVTWSLARDAPAGLVTIDAATGVLTVVAGLDYETLAGGIDLGGGQRAYDVGVTAAIGGTTPRTATTTVRVVLGNEREAPQLTVPSTLAAVEDVPGELSVRVDADAAATRLDLVLSVDRGTLTLGAFAGLDFSGGTDGKNDATIRFCGSPAAVAAALASLTFRPPTDASGAATITISVSDAGLGGSASDAKIALTISAVNDAPVAGPQAKPLSVEAGSITGVGKGALAATDVDDGPKGIIYQLAELSPFGDLRLDDVAMKVGHRFTQADVNDGRVSFAARQTGTATVVLSLADAGGAMAGKTTLTFEVKARPAAPVPAADVPAPAAAAPVAEAPVEAETVVAAAPRAAAAAPTFVKPRDAPSFAGLSSAAQSDGDDSGSTRVSVAQSSQQASDGGAAASPGLSAGAASAQPASVSVRVGSGGTGAVAAAAVVAAAVPGAAVSGAAAAAVAAAAVGSAQSGASAAGGLQAVASVASVAAFAGAQGPSAAGAPLAWNGVASDTDSDAPGAAGSAAVAGSSAGSGGVGGGSPARSGAGSATALPIDAWSPAVALRQADFRAELAQTRDEAVARFDTDRVMVASSVAISTSLSIGYVVWLARGGVLLTSLLASMPAWRSIDPLPVLARIDARGQDDGEEDDSLRGLLQRAADEQAERVAEAEALADRAAAPAGRLAQAMT
ncbi:MAG: DUF4347 domain-containing protein [Burkholderiales bacterium]|nr:DUF4347 domain-containing protein [Burkholderiales bacterium]